MKGRNANALSDPKTKMEKDIKYFWKKDFGTSYGTQERFNLLLLEPKEIYFEDFSAFYYSSDLKEDESVKKRQKGRLKMCSKSLVFDPLDSAYPILKFLFKDIVDLSKKTGSLLSKVDTKGDMLQIESKLCICMKEGNIIAPYVYNRQNKKYYFSLNFVGMNEVLPQIQQLLRAYTLNPRESFFMISTIVQSRQARISFNTSWIEDFYEKIIDESTASKITPLVCNPGRILLTSKTLYFQPFNNIETEPVLKIKLSSIKSVVKRRYLLRHVGIEFFLSADSADVYFIFENQSDRDNMYNSIINQEELDLVNEDQENMTIRWQSGALSNFDYLMYLNSKADRSCNDLTQYPVFPWVIQDYSSDVLDLDDPETFRDLSKPIGALGPQRLKQLKERSDSMPEPKFLYGSHYSSPGFVLYYLVRVAPEYMLCLQNGKFDKPDRLFNSLSATWNNCCTGHSDFKELIPEFYNSDGSFLCNQQGLNLGVKQDTTRVNNVELPPWADNAQDFISKCRMALECAHASERLHNWIDLIFGYKQRGEDAWEANNVFYYLTYEGAVDLDSIENINERHSYESQILEFGQTPKQLFTKPHPKRQVHLSSSYEESTKSIDTSSLDEIDQYIPVVSLHDHGIPLTIEIHQNNLHWVEAAVLWKSVKLHKEAIYGCQFTCHDENLFTVSQDTQMKMFSIENEKHLRCMNLSTMALSCCSIMDDEKHIFIGSWDNNIYTYSVESSRIVDEKHAHDDAVSCLCYKQATLLSSSWDSTVKVWNHDYTNKKSSLVLLGELDHDTEVTACDLSITDNCSFIASGTKDGVVTIWELDSLQVHSQYSSHAESVTQVLFSADGYRILSCSLDQHIKVVDVSTEVEIYSREIGERIRCACWDGLVVIAGGESGDIIVWDLIKDTYLTRLKFHKNPVTCITVSLKNKLLVSGSSDGYIAVWNTG